MSIGHDSKVFLARLGAVLLLLTGCASDGERRAAPPSNPDAGWVRRLATAVETGAESTELLGRAIEHPNQWVRLEAARAIGILGPADAVTRLSAHIGPDEKKPVRVAAIVALGLLHRAEALEPLVELLKNDPDPKFRRHAAVALGRLTGETVPTPAVTALRAALADEDPDVRGGAALAIWHHGDAAVEAIDDLARLLSDADPEVRWRAVYSLARIKDAKTHAPLLPMLTSKDPYARAFAARGMREPVNVDAIGALKKLLSDPASGSLARVEALRSLGEIVKEHAESRESVRDLLLEHLMREQHAGALEVLFGALAEGAGEIELPFLMATIERAASPTAQRAAVRALGRVSGEDSVALLKALAASEDPWLRVAVADSLGAVGAGAGPQLTVLLRDDDRRVRTAAAASVAKIEAPFRFPLLRTVVDDPDLAVRSTAVQAFADERPEGWREILEAAWKSSQAPEYWELRIQIMKTLAEHAPDAVPPLAKEALSDPFLAVRIEAARCLECSPPAAGEAPLPVGLPAERLDDPFAIDQPLRATIETDRGTMILELDLEGAPRHVASFVAQAESGAYDGLWFHRVVPSFVVQGADPRGDGWGDDGYHLVDEISAREYVRGTMGMPKAGDHTGGCQIFITHLPTPHLDGRYTIFGQVIEGLEVLDVIEVGDLIRRVTIDRPRVRRAAF